MQFLTELKSTHFGLMFTHTFSLFLYEELALKVRPNILDTLCMGLSTFFLQQDWKFGLSYCRNAPVLPVQVD